MQFCIKYCKLSTTDGVSAWNRWASDLLKLISVPLPRGLIVCGVTIDLVTLMALLRDTMCLSRRQKCASLKQNCYPFIVLRFNNWLMNASNRERVNTHTQQTKIRFGNIFIYTFCCSLRENTHLFAWNGDQQRKDTFISAKKRTFAHRSDSITIISF